MVDNKAGVIINRQSRNYGIDALRIISMLMIVTLHVLKQGGILDASESTNYWIAWFFEIAAFGAVDLYALISGYVGVYSKYKFSNLAVLWCRVAFYSVSITVICKFIIPDQVDKKMMLYSLFPIFTDRYWYFTAYALLFLFIPILNEGLNRLSKQRLTAILLAVVAATSAFQPIAKLLFDKGDVFVLKGGYTTWWLMIVYLIGGYIRKYGLFQKKKNIERLCSQSCISLLCR